MPKRFYSNGKLMLTGEYLVLDGALSLALPTKFGQDLVVEKASDKKISWKSYDADGSLWFEDCIDFSDIAAKKISGDGNLRHTLIEILHEAYQLNPDFLDADGYSVRTQLTFPRNWGLGTSSTLINNIAQWLGIDAFTLLKNSFGGSGYDIACAQYNQPVLYWLENGNPRIKTVDFNPGFHGNLYFVYLNKKQNSKAAISAYYKQEHKLDSVIPLVNAVTSRLLENPDYGAFSALLAEHEAIIGNVLHTTPVKESLFPDFNGSLKSLGAWGGDFILAVSRDNPAAYFRDRGYNTVIPYTEMIL